MSRKTKAIKPSRKPAELDAKQKATRRSLLLEAVANLRRYDHAFISETGCHDIAGSFGVKAHPTLHYADPTHPKGLTFNDGADSHVGMDAQKLAMSICDQLGVDYPDYFGRGSQLRGCCDALEEWAKTQ